MTAGSIQLPVHVTSPTHDKGRSKLAAFVVRRRVEKFDQDNYNYNRDLLCAPYKQTDGALHCLDCLSF